MRINATEHLDYTIEDIGNGKTLEVTIVGQWHEGEERTWDYPGTAPQFELIEVLVKTWDNDTDTDLDVPPSWIPFVDKIAFNWVEDNLNYILDAHYS